MALEIGQIIDGKYRISREIGTGSMGAVYEGENTLIHRRVAIKVLLPEVAESQSTILRFEREAQAAGRIGSEHIVEVLDLGHLPDGGYYLVMEYLEGTTLSQRIRSRGRLTPREVVPIIQQLLTGLESAHEAGIIHRDLKPPNVFLLDAKAGQSEFVKILDFGVSKFNPLHGDDAMSMTRTGAVMGTPFYMSPEQAKGARDIDPRSDLYSVGVILYQAVTGQVPFHAGTFNELIFKIVLETPPPPETFVPDLDPAFGRIIRKAMAREPRARYQSAAELCNALSVWLHTGADVASRARIPTPLPPPPSVRGSATPAATDEPATILMDPSERPRVLPGPAEMPTVIRPGRPNDAMPAPAGAPPASSRRRLLAFVVGGSAMALALCTVVAVAWITPRGSVAPAAAQATGAAADHQPSEPAAQPPPLDALDVDEGADPTGSSDTLAEAEPSESELPATPPTDSAQEPPPAGAAPTWSPGASAKSTGSKGRSRARSSAGGRTSASSPPSAKSPGRREIATEL